MLFCFVLCLIKNGNDVLVCANNGRDKIDRCHRMNKHELDEREREGVNELKQVPYDIIQQNKTKQKHGCK